MPLASELVKQCIYVLPIEVEIMKNEQQKFNDEIISYVRKDTRNSKLAKKQD